jgi:hypothetical protein
LASSRRGVVCGLQNWWWWRVVVAILQWASADVVFAVQVVAVAVVKNVGERLRFV